MHELLVNRMWTNSENTTDVPFEPSTLVELLRWRAQQQPDKLAYLFLVDGEEEKKESLTYLELDRKARAFAAVLQSSGYTGGRALLLYPSGLDYVVAFFGCLYAQMVAVPAYPPRPARVKRTTSRVWGIIDDAQPAVALCTRSLMSPVQALFNERTASQAPQLVTTDDIADEMAERWAEPPISSHTLAFLQYTSGSTATPKGVMVSHGNLLHNQRLIKLAFRQTEQSVIVGWLPLYHDMGLIGNILHPLYLGVPCVLMSPPAFLLNPLRWLKAISRYRATTSGGPNFAYELCARKISPEQRAELDLSSWTTAFNGAEPVRNDTMERFAAAFESCGFRREAFSPCYGLAESTLIVTGGARSNGFVTHTVQAAGLEQNQVVAAPATTHEATRTLVGCSQPLLDQQVVIVDPETSTLSAPDSIGEIWVSGPSVTHGYWNQPEETTRTFHAYLSDTGDGPFLRTGDLGFLNNGHLFVVGRLKDMIVIRGRNHFPQDFELTVEQSHTALRAGCGAAFSVDEAGEEVLVVVQEVDYRRQPNIPEVIECIRQALSEEHEVQVHTIVLIKAGTIPKTSSGKIQRHACRVKYLSGVLELIGQWQQESPREDEEVALDSTTPIRDAEDLQAWFKSQLAVRLRVPVEEIDVTQPIARYGMDSLTAIELTHSIEARLGVILPIVSFLQSPSITQLADKVLAELRTSSATNEASIKTSGQVTVEHPLSYGQRALYFLHRLAPESAAYNISSAVRILSPLDTGALRRAFQSLVDRHASLRTTFDVDQAGEPVQLVHEKVEVTFREDDAGGWSEELRNRLAARAHQPFDLEHGPLLRVNCYRLSATEHVLLLSVHHIVADFWSLSVLANELGITYVSEQAGTSASLPPLTLQYGDYARWQTEFLTEAVSARLGAYWEKQLAGDLPILNLPTDHPRPAVQSFRGASQPFDLNEELMQRLKALSKMHGITVYVTLLSAFQVLLHRYTGQDDIVLGSPTAGRSLAELAGLVGYFVNPVAVRADLSGDPTFTEVLERTSKTVLEAFEHQDYPFTLLVERLQPVRDLSMTPVFQAMFVLQRAHLLQEEGLASFGLGEEGVRMELGTLTVESMNLPQRVAQFDLMLMVAETSNGLSATFEYSADLFEAETVERMGHHYRRLLEAAVADPALPVSALPLMDQGERRLVLEEWNETANDYARHLCLHQLFEQQVARTPERTALLAADGEYRYDQLNERANRLARLLIERGLQPEDRVGVMLSRTSRLPVALLAVLKAGGAYVPLDPRYPASRLRLMCADAGLRLLLTETTLLESVPEGVEAPVLCLDRLGEELEAFDSCDLGVAVSSRQLAYVIYTSGSTGVPKGVAIEHKSAVCLVSWAGAVFSAEEFSGALASTSINFDLSVFELFAPLACGGRVILAGDVLETATASWRDEVRLINTVPSAMAELVRAGTVPAGVVTVNLAGEALGRRLVQDIYAAGVKHVNNLYGPTEDTTYTTWVRVADEDGAAVTIGRGLWNTRLYILDGRGAPVPAGVAGEVWVAGEGLARGYFGRAAQTAERFRPDAFAIEPGGRMYQTGDIGRYVRGGEIEYLGRGDEQVKVRGFRIELGEIEAALVRHAGVEQAVVVARAEAGGDKRLVAYVVETEGQKPTSEELRRHVKQTLPEYMVPAAFVRLTELPLTPNGKVNRRALPAPDNSNRESEAAFVAPATEIEKLLAGIWAEVLGIETIGVGDNFFELGGHSLLAMRVVARAREAFRIEVSLPALFESPTVAELSRSIEQELAGGEKLTLEPIKRSERAGALPLSFAQQRLWLLEQLGRDKATYNIPVAVRFTGSLDVGALERSLNQIVQRHESLRTRFVDVGGEPVQVIEAEASLTLEVRDLSALPEQARESEAWRLMRAGARRSFDVSRGPLLRATLLRLRPEEQVVMLVMHHIISDGWSLGVLVRELVALYEAETKNEPALLPALPVQYVDFAVWQNGWLHGEALEAQLGYWRRQLAGEIPVLQLPVDRPRPAVQSFRGASHTLVLPPSLVASIKTLARTHSATPFMLLLSGFCALLQRYTNQSEFLVGTPVANRTRPELEGLIGFFVNTLVLRADVSDDPSFLDLLKRVRQTALEAYAHQDLPFEKLVEALNPTRDLSRSALFQVMFVQQEETASSLRLPGLTVERLEVGTGTAKFEQTWAVQETGEGSVEVRVEYSADLFDLETVERMGHHYRKLLEAAVANPTLTVSDLPLIDEAERLLLEEWGRGAMRSLVESRPVHELFAAQVKTNPSAVAVECGAERVSYAELDQRARSVVQRLRALGVGRGDLVGVCVERSAAMVAALLGVLKLGGAYVPVDPATPQRRVTELLNDAGVKVVICDEANETLVRNVSAAVLPLNSAVLNEETTEEHKAEISGDDLAYVIYTSGSTGTPKGVMVSHRALSNHLLWRQQTYPLTHADKFLQKASIGFDISVWEIFAPLIAGARLVLAKPGGHQDSAYLVKLIAEQNITVIHFGPSMLEVMLHEDGIERCTSLRHVFCGGEPLPAALQDLFFSRLNAELHQQYGPTETCIDVTIWDCVRESGPPVIPIGRPIANTHAYVLDANQRPVPVGVAGELHIGGAALAHGYLRRPELTAEKFIPSPFTPEPGARLYKTGDLARFLPDGNLQFLSRIDHQVKIRGFRVEPGEIEATLRQYPGVRDAVVLVREDDPGDKRLVGYLLVAEGMELNTGALRNFMKERLPDYMTPSAFVSLHAWPLTTNGKIDRRALPAPDQNVYHAGEELDQPRNEVEETLTGLWADALKLPAVGIHDNFFELGGHSLLAMRLMSRVRERFQMEIELRVLFETPTVAGMAAHIEQGPSSEDARSDSELEMMLSDESNVEKLLAALDRLSEADAQKMLDEKESLLKRVVDTR